MTKIDKPITSKLYSIIKICIANNVDANKIIQKLGKQMIVQLVAYLVFFLPLHHSSWTFQFINICPFEERAFVLKSQVALNGLEPNSIDIMCSSIIDKCINCPNQYELLSLIEFSSFYNIKKKSKRCKPKIIRFVNYNKYKYI